MCSYSWPTHSLGVWDIADLSIEFEYDMTDLAIASLRVRTLSGTLYVMASVEVSGRTLFVDGLHMHGVQPNAIGLANLRRLASFVMLEYSYDEIIVQGGVRMSGANPGRTPGLLRFTREA